MEKNSNIYKLYQASINGEVKEIRKEIIYEDENFTSYIEGDRAYIKFTMKCKRQLIYALKKKGWWWNSYKSAWSTYLDRVNTEWIKNISENTKSICKRGDKMRICPRCKGILGERPALSRRDGKLIYVPNVDFWKR